MEIEEVKISSSILFKEIKKMLAENRQASFTVTGMSMWPLLCNERDRVIVQKVVKEDLRVGDIVLYCVPDEQYILHRITRLEEHFFQTTGDGNLFRDPPVSYDTVVARTCKVIRNGKMIDCSGCIWRMLFQVWMILFPIRKWIFRAWFSVRKYKKKY